MDMRTPYRRVTGLGSARGGTGHFWRQRLSALANIPLTLFLVWFILAVAGGDRAGIAASLANPLVAGLMILTIISFTWHMKLGAQMVIEDYLHGGAIKLLAIIANIFFAVILAVLGVIAVLQLAFGG